MKWEDRVLMNVREKEERIMRVQTMDGGNAKTQINRNFYCGHPIEVVLRKKYPILSKKKKASSQKSSFQNYH